jgi:hypothetical protein
LIQYLLLHTYSLTFIDKINVIMRKSYTKMWRLKIKTRWFRTRKMFFFSPQTSYFAPVQASWDELITK